MLDIEQRASLIRRKMHLIFDDKQRIGVQDNEVGIRVFKNEYSEDRQCKCCNQKLSAEDAYWYSNHCEPCERESFLVKELNKLSSNHAVIVKKALLGPLIISNLIH